MTDQLLALLRTVPLFADMTDGDLRALIDQADVVRLQPKEVLFREGEDGDRAYVICEGEVEILKKSGNGEALLARNGPGDVIGEIALLMGERRSATVRAGTETAMLGIKRGHLSDLVNTSLTASRAVYSILLERWRNTESKLRHSERMAQLGTLSAGLAHELNNPAAALKSAAARLPDAMRRRDEALAGLAGESIPESTRTALDAFTDPAGEPGPRLSGLERSDRQEEMERILTDLQVGEVRRLAPGVVDAGLGAGDVRALAEGVTGEQLGAVLRFLTADADLTGLFGELRLGAGRISDLVDAMKRYSYLDQAPVQVVNVVDQIEDTLLILASKMRGIIVEREFQEGIPEIEAYGSELNQVWTNLLDNAVHAIRGAQRDPGIITIRVGADEASVQVEIEDNGTGIPEGIRHRIFDAFFTTKPPGEGTGLGLDIAHSIVADRHRGTLGVATAEGWTRFTVEIPRKVPLS